jgi:deoxyribose-phosphate aldolase
MSTLPQTRSELARRIDHTLLRPEATQMHIDQLCDECLEYGFAAACVNPVWAGYCAGRLAGSESAVATVAGFPLGASTPEVKAFEALMALECGVREIDMVVNVGALIAGQRDVVRWDIHAVVDTARRAAADSVVKVILETRVLSDEQIILGCQCAAEAGADFVKTSTGFHAAGGATVEHVKLLRQHAGRMKVKASGGIRDLPTALAMIEAGADRLGMSASVSVIRALDAR